MCVFSLTCLPLAPPSQQKEKKVTMRSEEGHSIVLNCNPPQSSMQPIIHWMDWSECLSISFQYILPVSSINRWDVSACFCCWLLSHHRFFQKIILSFILCRCVQCVYTVQCAFTYYFMYFPAFFSFLHFFVKSVLFLTEERLLYPILYVTVPVFIFFVFSLYCHIGPKYTILPQYLCFFNLENGGFLFRKKKVRKRNVACMLFFFFF